MIKILTKKNTIGILFAGLFLLACVAGALALERFPPPDFDTDHTLPVQIRPAARGEHWAWIDMGVLLVSLLAGTVIVLKTRSRRAMVWLSLFAVGYFGFFRKGCVCPIGAIQNVADALAHSSLVVPLVVLFFFGAPLLLAVFFGRIFCGGVCPLGALQDLVLLKPLRVPRWLDTALGMFRHVYLGLAVLFAAMGASYLICVYDPFVGFFRMNARFHIWVLSGLFLLLSMVVGRPYCRYLCPYGALLCIFSRFSARRVTITPDRCINCGLCREACPYGAIHPSTITPDAPPKAPADSLVRLRRLILGAGLVAVLGYVGWETGAAAGPWFSRDHFTIRVAEKLVAEETQGFEERSFETQAYLDQGLEPETIYQEALLVKEAFTRGSRWFGLWVGLVLSMTMLSLLQDRPRQEYEADKGACLACGRCYASCPIDERNFQGDFDVEAFEAEREKAG